MSSIQIGYFDQDYEIDSEEEPKKKLLSLQRKAFIHSELSANLTFSMKSLCWYDMPLSQVDFQDGTEVTKEVNEWAKESIQKSVEIIDANDEEMVFHPLAGHAGNVGLLHGFIQIRNVFLATVTRKNMNLAVY